MTSLSQPLQAVVTLFEGPLAGVRFGKVDAAELSKLAAEVATLAKELEQQEAKIVELKQGVIERQDALAVLAQQALAYARIYAEGDEELSAKLSEISLPRAAKPRKAAAAKGTDDAAAKPPASASVAERETTPEEVDDDASAAPAKTKPAYERPKVKRRLGRAASQGDSA